ncbi:MAG: P-loop NTPase fold protein [Anaerolineales bacterium]
MTRFHTDAPITGQPGSEDQLNRTEFAKRVGQALLLAPDSPALVVSLEGKWGYGKTSVINLIIGSLEFLPPGERPIIFKFNPWIVGSAERLVEVFLTQLASEIGISDTAQIAQRAVQQLLTYSKLFSVLKFVPGVGPYAALLETVTTAVGSATDAVADLKSANIDEQRAAATAALKDLDRPIVVFIDDIDRLPPSEVFQMVRLVKAIADFPRMAFVLAFDPAYVEKALQHYDIEDARAYLDKLVQTRIHLPQISVEDIHRLSTDELTKLADIDLTSHFDGDKDRFGELYYMCCKPLMRSVRDVKRLFNRLRFSEPATRREVCFSDMYGLEVLAIKAPTVYELLRVNPGAYTGITLASEMILEKPEDYVARYKEDRETAMSSVAPEDRKYMSDLVEKLFPLTSDSTWEHRDQDYFRTHGRVGATDRLMIALSFGLPSDEVSTQDVHTFINTPETRSELIEAHIISHKMERFVELLRDAVKTSRPPDGADFLLALGGIAEDPRIGDLDEQRLDVLGVSVTRQLWWVAAELLENSPANERPGLLVALCGSGGRLALSTECLHACLAQHGFYGEQRSVPETERLCDAETLERLKKLWLDKVRTAFQDESILEANGKGPAIFLLRRLDAELARELVAPFLRRDEDLDRIVKVFGVSGRDSHKGKYAHVSSDDLDSFGGSDLLKARAKERFAAGPIEDMELTAIYQSILTGNRYYLIDASEGDPI